MSDRRNQTGAGSFTRRAFLGQAARIGTGAAGLVSLGDRGGWPRGLVTLAEAQTPKRGGTLRFGLPNEPLTLSGTMTGGDQGFGVRDGGPVRTSLLDRLHDEYRQAEPGGAWSRKDAKTWIVKLRQGVQFHKGYGEMTAEDVAFTINTMIEKKHTGAFTWNSVQGAGSSTATPSPFTFFSRTRHSS